MTDLTNGNDRLNVATPTITLPYLDINNINAKNVINGLEGDDIIDAGNGSDTVNGDDGNDILFGGSGGDQVNGGDGNDIIIDTGGTMTGGKGHDVFIIDGGNADGGRGQDAFLMQKNKPSGPTNDDGPGDINSDYLGGLQGGKGFDRIHATMDDQVLAVRNFSADQSIEMITASGVAKEDTDELSELEALRHTIAGGDKNLSAEFFTGLTLSGGNNKDILDFSATLFRGVEAVNVNNGPDTVTTAKEHRGVTTDYDGGSDGDHVNVFLTADQFEALSATQLAELLDYIDDPRGKTLDLSNDSGVNRGLTATDFESASLTDGIGNGFIKFCNDDVQYVIGDDGDNRIKNFDTRKDQVLIGNEGADDFRFGARDSDDGFYLASDSVGDSDSSGGNATIKDLDFGEGDRIIFATREWQHADLDNRVVASEADLAQLIFDLNNDEDADFLDGKRFNRANDNAGDHSDLTKAFADDDDLVLRVAGAREDDRADGEPKIFEEIIIEDFAYLLP